jgi:hypothetical protein
MKTQGTGSRHHWCHFDHGRCSQQTKDQTGQARPWCM